MAELGHDVVGVEVHATKLTMLEKGEVPSPPELLSKHVTSGRLRLTSDLREAAAVADVHFVCFGTPQRPDTTGADLTNVDATIEALAPLLTRPSIVVGKSTVPARTASRLAAASPSLRRWVTRPA